jgi:Zinc carboxypeptidase
MKSLSLFVYVFFHSVLLLAQDGIFHAAGTPSSPKVQIVWNRYNNYDGITDICKRLAAAYPELIKLGSIGKSFQGREMWVLSVTDYKKGKAEEKPGFYLDGNIHSNEIQGTEMALYTAWYLVESYGNNENIRELLSDKVFYIVPTINPDARDDFMKKPNSPHSPRSGMIPVDNDRDNVINEDGFDDLDGDGNICLMIRKNQQGRLKKDPNDPGRLISVKPEEQGEYEILGFEGIDNDGDGRVNEDGEGFSYDPNRDWGWRWMPNYVQNGAYKYPFSLPENRNIRNFVMDHPNIAGAQSFHNNGGMILRGPGAEDDVSTYNADDIRIYDVIGKKGESMIPGYNYIVIYKDLYTVFGGEVDWFYGGRGVYTFSNELFTSYMYFGKKSVDGDDDGNEIYNFNKLLLFGDGIVPWKEFNHPQYGKIEVGGARKNFTRADPGFLLESDAHRNMSFVLYHAYHMPKLDISEITEKDLGSGLTEVTTVVSNLRVMPTHSSQDIKNKIERPDLISLEGAKVVAGMIVDNRDMGITHEQKNNPSVLEVESIRGMGAVTVRWIIQKGKNYTIKVDSRKGGVVSRQK